MVADEEPQRCGTIAEVHKGDRKHPVGPIRATLEILLWTAMGANLSDPALEAKFPTAPNIRKPLMRTCWRSTRFTAGSGGQPSIYPSGRHLFEFVYCLVGCAHYGRSIRYMQVYPCTTRAAETSRAAAMTIALHKRFTVATDVQVYFCDPQSPWQRGSNENTNGLLREYFPKGTDLSRHSQQDLDAIADKLNTRPRKTLDYVTPADKLATTVAATG